MGPALLQHGVERWIRALIDAKRLQATKIGNAWLIDPKDLDAVKKRKPGRPRKAKKD